MRVAVYTRTICKLALLTSFAALTGCSSLPQLTSSSASGGNIFSYRAPPAEAVPLRKSEDIDCPIVQVADGQASFRAYNGADRSSAGVRYQYSFGEMSRECLSSSANQIEMRIGISGYVLAGPAGASGTFNVPVKVTIRSESNQAIVVSKTYRVDTSIPAGESQSTFSLVTEPLPVPYVSRDADEDYSIFVGFDGGSGNQPKQKQKQVRHRRR